MIKVADLKQKNDQELQALLVIEKNYAANAKVLQTVDEMINTLLGL